jgi:hypothetical protein
LDRTTVSLGLGVHMTRKARKLPSLEKNLLKYRAFEMLLVLFEVEDLKRFVVRSIRSTDAILGKEPRLPDNAPKLMKRAWGIVAGLGILTDDECEDVQRFVAYRDTIAHRIHEMTADVSEFARRGGNPPFKGYDYEALRKIRDYKRKIQKGFQEHFIMEMSLNALYFEPAQLVFEDELVSLRKRIDKQWDERTKALRKKDRK